MDLILFIELLTRCKSSGNPCNKEELVSKNLNVSGAKTVSGEEVKCKLL